MESENRLDGGAVVVQHHPPGRVRICFQPSEDFKAAAVAAGNGRVVPQVGRASEGQRRRKSVEEPLLMKPVHMGRQPPCRGEHHFRHRDSRDDHPERLHAPRSEDRLRGFSFWLVDQHAVNIEEDDGSHGRTLCRRDWGVEDD